MSSAGPPCSVLDLNALGLSNGPCSAQKACFHQAGDALLPCPAALPCPATCALVLLIYCTGTALPCYMSNPTEPNCLPTLLGDRLYEEHRCPWSALHAELLHHKAPSIHHLAQLQNHAAWFGDILHHPGVMTCHRKMVTGKPSRL